MGGHHGPYLTSQSVGLRGPSSPSGVVEVVGIYSFLSMAPPVQVEVTATADAMALQTVAGLDGAAFFPNGRAVWFQFQITLDQACALWNWVEDDMQKHTEAWELLAQYALTYCIVSCLPRCRGPGVMSSRHRQ